MTRTHMRPYQLAYVALLIATSLVAAAVWLMAMSGL